MTVKQFFKSTSFKCIVSLLCILLVCGIFLTVAYGFLEVTEGEKLQLAINKIYTGQNVTIYGLDDSNNEVVIDNTVKNPTSYVSEKIVLGNAEILAAYKIEFDNSEEINYLVQSLGKGGYSGGSVTCWVPVKISKTNTIVGIGQVSISANSGQSFIGKITNSFLERFSTDYTEGIYYEIDKDNGFVSSGASLSSSAICNAVNGAIEYVKTERLGEEISYPYSGFAYTDTNKINIENPNSDFIVEANGNVTFTIVTTSNPPAGSFTVEITVNSEKTIVSYTIKKYGSVSSSKTDAEEYNAICDQNVAVLIGKNESYFKNLLGDDGLTDSNASYAENGLTTGATRSSYQLLYCGLFATANYDAAIAATEVTNNE